MANSSSRKRWRRCGRRSLRTARSEEHTSELQSHVNLVCRLLLEKKKKNYNILSFATNLTWLDERPCRGDMLGQPVSAQHSALPCCSPLHLPVVHLSVAQLHNNY